LKEYLVDQYSERSSSAWNRDYSSIDAFLRSVEPNRGRLGIKGRKAACVEKKRVIGEKQYVIEGIQAEWYRIASWAGHCPGILAFPPNSPKAEKLPLVIVQHGIGSTPETTFREAIIMLMQRNF
jgi:hypothetical protein